MLILLKMCVLMVRVTFPITVINKDLLKLKITVFTLKTNKQKKN